MEQVEMRFIWEIIEILLYSVFGLGIPTAKSLLEFKSQVESALSIFPIEKAISICIAVFSLLGIILAIARRIMEFVDTHKS